MGSTYVLIAALSFFEGLRKYKKSKKKIPLKFGIEHKNYNLLSWIVYYKDLSFLYSFQKIGINFFSVAFTT